MVSIRRRKLLGSGRNSFLVQLPRFSDNGNIPENHTQYTKSVGVHPMPSVDLNQPKEINIPKLYPGSSNISGSSSSKEEQNQHFSGCFPASLLPLFQS